MIWSISWRNVWRSKLRSSVVIGAITLGIFAGVFSIAFIMGWMDQRTNTVIKTEVSHIQLHHPGYLASGEVKDYMDNATGKLKTIKENEKVKVASARIISNCMIQSAETNTGVQLLGIDPENEKQVTNISKKVTKGSYFTSNVKNGIVIGNQLAEKLNARIKSKVVVTLQEMDGTITGGAFRVVGIYNISNTSYEEMKAFVRKEHLAELIKMDATKAHEIAVLLNQGANEQAVAQEIKDEFPDTQVMTWAELMPDIQLMNENMDMMMYIVIGIILLALLFGIVNTMLMVIMERVKELGMLMAIGMNRTKVYLMILLETVYLCLTGGVTGILLATGITALTHQTGINLSAWSQGLNAYGFESIVYPQIGIEQIINVTLMVIAIGIIAAIYPAWKAIRLKPAEAIRIDN